MNNPKFRQQWILDELKINPNLGFSELFSKYSVEFSKSEKTFSLDWNKANEDLKQYLSLINNAKLEESISLEKEAIRNGLKTKFDRLMILQKLVDECLEQLATKQCNDTITIGESVKNIKRLMNQRELNDTRKTLQSLQSEISKIEGDYAPTKIENSIIASKEVAEEVKKTIADIISKHLE